MGRQVHPLHACEHNCRECGRPMAVIQQENMRGGFITLITCWNPDCLLCTVTLSVDQYNGLTECQMEAYREMNRKSRTQYLTA